MTPNSTALVTGGGSGIGRAIAVTLAEHGRDVLIVGRRADSLADTAALHDNIRTHRADIGDPAALPAVVDAAGEHLDVLVNNAGVGRPALLGDIDATDAERMWRTNLLGPTLLTQAALPRLLADRGAIVNVSSTFGAKPAPRLSVYGATKAGLEHLTRSWALELADRGVRVNAVAPGPVESEGLTAMGLSPAEIEQVKAHERASIPLGRRGVPADVAGWVLALCAPELWMTGQVIAVDGGYVLA